MPRSPESRVPPTEPLYRSLSVDDVVNGQVLPHAVDAPQCSFNRSAYSQPQDVLTAARPSDTGIAEVTGARLPGPFPRASGGAAYIFAVQDDPNPPEDPTNDAHCEVRLGRDGVGFVKNHKVDKVIKAQARAELARVLTIIKAPV